GGTAAVAATGTLLSSSRPDSVQTVDVDGVTAIVGGIALLGAGGTAAVAATGTLLSSSRPDSVQTVDVDGVTAI
ncbi:hypothetical protein CTI14_70505, partial [Methylobacterium radiotolerans]